MAMTSMPSGDSLIVSFKATELGIWFDAEATVARVIRGRRPKDRGRCVGLSFTRFDAVSRLLLRGHLRRTAPPLPQRPPRDCADRLRGDHQAHHAGRLTG